MIDCAARARARVCGVSALGGGGGVGWVGGAGWLWNGQFCDRTFFAWRFFTAVFVFPGLSLHVCMSRQLSTSLCTVSPTLSSTCGRRAAISGCLQPWRSHGARGSGHVLALPTTRCDNAATHLTPVHFCIFYLFRGSIWMHLVCAFGWIWNAL